MANIAGSVPVGGFVAPSSATDTYAVTVETYNRGGYRSVANSADRLAITTDRRLVGMLVKQLDTGEYWTLSGGVADANWQLANLGSSNLTLGETNATAYRGDRGKTAYDHSRLTTGNPHNVTKADVGLSNVINAQQEVISNKGVANGYASLDSTGKIPVSQVPVGLAVIVSVANESVRLSLAQNSNLMIALQADTQIEWIINANADPSVSENWINCGSYASQVVSVNGQTGAVTINCASIGAVATSTTINSKALTGNITLEIGDIIVLSGDTGKFLRADGTLANVSYNDLTNTPTIPTALSGLTDDATHRFVTDTEKSTWNNKQNTLGFTPENSVNKGIANGYASLDSDGKVPSSQLPTINGGTSNILIDVKVDFGAVGDGVINDTTAIQNALNMALTNGGGVVYIPPNGIYMFSNLTVPKNVTLKMSHLADDYAFTNANLNQEFYGLKRISGSTGAGIVNYGKLENININGNYDSSNSAMVENHKWVDGLFITKAYDAIKLVSGNMNNILCYGNQHDGLVIDACDFIISNFSMASNNGNGLTGITMGTGLFTNGRFEWNYKHNMDITYANEVTFTNVIVDAANWYGMYSRGQFSAVHFNNCFFLGSHRRVTTPIEDSQYYSMFMFKGNATQVNYTNCTFEASSDPNTENYDSILTYTHQYASKAIIFDNCFINTVPIYKSPKSTYASAANIYVTGSSFESNGTDDRNKRYNMGALTVIPDMDSSSIASFSPFIQTGVLVYDWQKKKLLINLWGTFRDVLGNDISVDTSLSDITTINNHTTTYAYNTNDTVQSVTEKDASNNTIKVVTYNYDANGNVTSAVTSMNGKTVTTTYNYDIYGKVTSTVNVIS